MKRLIPIVLFMFAVAIALPQQYMPNRRKAFQPSGGGGASWYPTNIAGKIPKAYWTAENYTTNAGIAELVDLMGNGFTLSASALVSPIKRLSTINGYATLIFSGAGAGTPLLCGNYTIANSVNDVVVLCSVTNSGGSNPYLFAGTNSSDHAYRSVNTVPRHDVWVGPEQIQFSGSTPDSSFCIYHVRFLYTDRAVYTNNVLVGSYGTALTDGDCNGFKIGSRYDSGSPIQMAFVMLLSYTNTLTDIERTSVFNAIKTMYGL